jgi:hypothetical protein
MNDIVFGIAIIPLIVGLVQMVKGLGLDARYAPVASVALGVGGGVLMFLSGGVTTLPEGILSGIAFGLSASGLYSGANALRGV